MTQILIRNWDEDDVPVMNQMVRDLAQHLGDTVKPRTRDLLHDLQDESIGIQARVAADTLGKPVGFTLFQPTIYSSNTNEQQAFVIDLYVQPKHRGKRIATRLLKSVAKWSADTGYAKGRGFGYVRLEVNLDNEVAYSFYKSLGFETYAYTKRMASKTSRILHIPIANLL